MNYISEIFGRLDIQCIREFLLHGCDEIDTDHKSYIERLKKPEKEMYDLLHGKFPDENEYEEVMNKIYDYAGSKQEVYMEIGLQCGFILAMQMNRNTNPNNQ